MYHFCIKRPVNHFESDNRLVLQLFCLHFIMNLSCKTCLTWFCMNAPLTMHNRNIEQVRLIYLRPTFCLKPPWFIDIQSIQPSYQIWKQSVCSATQCWGINHKRQQFIPHNHGIVATAAKPSAKANDLWLCSNNDETESLPYRQAPRWIILIDCFMACWYVFVWNTNGWDKWVWWPWSAACMKKQTQEIFVAIFDHKLLSCLRLFSVFHTVWY